MAKKPTLENVNPEGILASGVPTPDSDPLEQVPPMTVAPVPAATASEGKVLVEKTDLDKLFDTIKKQGDQIKVLFEVADKGRLAKNQSMNKGGQLIKTVKVSVWADNNKIILGWKLTKNVSEIVNGRWIEDQKTMLVFEDGTTEEINLLDFYRKIHKIKAEILSKRTNDTGGKISEVYKLKLDDGREIEIGADFIN